MGCKVLKRLEGKQINGEMLGPDGKLAKILHAVRIDHFFRDEEQRVELTICYTYDHEGDLIAYLGRVPAEGKKTERRGRWKIRHVENLNQKGLVGFSDYARFVGITPAQLVHNITLNRPKGLPSVIEE